MRAHSSKLLVVVGLLAAGPALGQGGGLSTAEMMKQGSDYVAKIKDSIKAVSQLAEDARKQNDIIKLTAVSDRLMQLNGMANVAEQSLSAMQQAANRGDTATVASEFSKLTIVYQKASVLVQESRSAVGASELQVGGKNANEVDVSPNIPREEVQNPPPTPFQPTPLPVDRPPAASGA